MTNIQKEIILAYANNNMNICQTARKVFYNRNTVSYQLNKIKEQTGLDPQNFYNLIELVRLVEAEVTEQ